MKKLLCFLIISLPLFAGNLQLESASVEAHTEMMMDSAIDPISSQLLADINMQDENIASLNGKFWIQMNSFSSEKQDRDENMYETLDSEKYKLATYTITSLAPTKDVAIYTIHGKLNFHGVEQELEAKANITMHDNIVDFEASTMINMPDYGIEMPCMVFMCVREQVDLRITASFTKELL